jgi:hypothetical protein
MEEALILKVHIVSSRSRTRLIPSRVLSLPGLTGQSSIPGQWLLDRPVKPGDDSIECVKLITKSRQLPRYIEKPHGVIFIGK